MEQSCGNREFEEYLERDVVILLKDERYLYGVLKSFDQYNSVSLNFTVERIFFLNRYAENRLGLISLRGENIVMMGLCSPDFSLMRKMKFEALAEEIESFRSKFK